ncbi:MAG: thiamine diphosphokinase, partial [Pseudomonadota bacterium]
YRLAHLGVQPSRIIGDLDSMADPAAWRAAGVAVDAVAEQDTTDFEKCLYRTEAPLYLAVGFTGVRVDHTLAVLNTLVRRADKRVILVAEREVIFPLPPGRRLRLEMAPGDTVSIFPLAPLRCAPSQGLTWPLDGLVFAPGQRIGTSNRALGGPMEIGFEDPGALVFLPHDCLPALIEATAP